MHTLDDSGLEPTPSDSFLRTDIRQFLGRRLLDDADLHAFRPWMHGLLTLFAASSILGYLFFLVGDVLLVPPLVGAAWLLLTLAAFRLVHQTPGIRQEYTRTLILCTLTPLGWIALISEPLGTQVAFSNIIFVTCAALTLTLGAALSLVLLTFVVLGIIRSGQTLVEWEAGLSASPLAWIQVTQIGAIFVIHFLSISLIVSLLWIQTERDRRGRLELEASHAKLKESERARGVFLSTVTHELRTPLTSIHGYLDLLMLKSNHEDAQELSIIKRAATRLQNLTDEFLNIADPPSLASRMNFEALDLGELVREEISLLRQRAAEAGVQVRDRTTTPCRIQGDRLRISQVISNLLTNALDHSPSGTTVTVTAHQEGSSIRVTVADEGVGIPPESLPHIFAPFYTQTSAVKTQKGVGLGLTICKQIVEATGGSILVQSDSPCGTTFSIQFPATTEAPSLPAPCRGTPRVLILDDEPDIRLLMELQLVSLGFEVSATETGMEALEVARQNDFDLLVLDVNVPGPSGVDVSRQLRANGCRATIFMFTAMPEQEIYDCVVAAGADGHIPKPWDLPWLENRLRTAGVMPEEAPRDIPA